MSSWEYLTEYISGALDFPENVPRSEVLDWAAKSITSQLNSRAALGWDVIDLRWLSDLELMVTFKRPAAGDAAPAADRTAPPDDEDTAS